MRRRAKSMVAILDGDDDAKKLEDLCTLKYEHQAKWFINGIVFSLRLSKTINCD